MKKLIIGLVFLLSIMTVKAATYNCTANETIIIPDCICTPTPCPECPVLPNQTVVIQNLTVPNITCKYDTAGFAESIGECIDSLDSCQNSLQICDSEMTEQAYMNQTLKQSRMEVINLRSEKDKIEKGFSTYGLQADYILCLIGGIVACYYYTKEKLKPAGVTSRLGRE